ncbi:MAG: MBL fold metallo-hydrolase [Pseudomonadota bacterium]|nr:MBL fold metallo-hydrolase [Pseudomonadota bacterium]
MHRRGKLAKRVGRSSAVLLLMIAGALLLLSRCEQFGAVPTGPDHQRMTMSPNYNPDQDIFVNEDPDVIEEMLAHSGFWANPRKNLSNNFLFNPNTPTPNAPLPEVRGPLPDDLRDTSDTVKFTWLGHATVLASINGKTILFDPVFSESAAPVSWAVKRYQPPAIGIEELPQIDFIVISHDHYDHLDMNAVKFFKESNTRFLVPLGVASHLEYWGISRDKVTEFDWWQSRTIAGITFTCAPAQHFSGRTGTIAMQKTLWSSWAVRTEATSVYFSGDSGYAGHFKEIGDRLGPFDLTFIDAGQYNERWRQVHNLPPEVMDAFDDLRGDILVPIGWGMFTLALHDWYEPPVEISSRAFEIGATVAIPRFGEWVDIRQRLPDKKWWEPLIE